MTVPDEEGPSGDDDTGDRFLILVGRLGIYGGHIEFDAESFAAMLRVIAGVDSEAAWAELRGKQFSAVRRAAADALDAVRADERVADIADRIDAWLRGALTVMDRRNLLLHANWLRPAAGQATLVLRAHGNRPPDRIVTLEEVGAWATHAYTVDLDSSGLYDELFTRAGLADALIAAMDENEPGWDSDADESSGSG